MCMFPVARGRRRDAEILVKSRAYSPNTVFLALSVSDSPQDVGSVIRARAQGYVTKTISGDDLISSIKQVHEGYAVFSPKLAGFVLSAFQNGSPAGMGGSASGPITMTSWTACPDREQEVMRLIARGYTVQKEVAAELFISIKNRGNARHPYYANCSCQTAPNSPAGPPTAASYNRRIFRLISSYSA